MDRLRESRKDIIPPCKGCELRHTGCHASCDRYAEWSKEQKERKDQDVFERDCRYYDFLARRRRGR